MIIQNVSRYCDDIYECVASNGVPPAVSRKMRVTVECKSTFYIAHLTIDAISIKVRSVTQIVLRTKALASQEKAIV